VKTATAVHLSVDGRSRKVLVGLFTTLVAGPSEHLLVLLLAHALAALLDQRTHKPGTLAADRIGSNLR
jgi:hypothetical protein